MKNILSPIAFASALIYQNAYCEEQGISGQKVLASVLVVAGIGGLAYESRKSVNTTDSSQTKLLGGLSLVGGLVLFYNARDKTSIALTSYQKSPVISFRLEI